MAEVLSYWSKRRGEAVKKYWEFVLEGIGEVHREEYYEVEEQRYLGEEEFIEQVKKERQETVEDVPVRVSMEEVVEETGRQWDKDVGEI